MTRFDDGMAVARAIAEEFGVDVVELRAFAAEHLSSDWPEGYGISSSDVNHHLAELGNGEPELLREEAARVKERNELVARVAASTGKSEAETLAALTRLLAPAEEPAGEFHNPRNRREGQQ